MAHIARLKVGSTIVADLAANGAQLLFYKPVEPLTKNALDVTEQCRVLYEPVDDATMKTYVRALQDAFIQAETYVEKQEGDRVWFEFQLDRTSELGRAELFAGRVSGEDEMIASGWAQRKIVFTLFWTRTPFFELDEVALPLSNANGTDTTSGLTVWMHDDAGAGHDSYAEVKAAHVTGVGYVPVRLELSHTYPTSNAANIYVALNRRPGVSSFQHILEGEAATGGTTQSNATCSGGQYKAVTWSGDTAQKILEWSLSAAQLGYLNGARTRFSARFLTPPTNAWLHWRVLYGGVNILAQTDEVLVSTDTLQHLGDTKLPPRRLGDGPYADLSLALYARKVGGGTADIDFAHLGVMDGFRTYPRLAFGLSNGMRLVDDAINRDIWVDTGAGTGRLPFYGKPLGTLMLKANTLQRLYFLATTTTGSAPIERTFSVKAFYRPRRLTI